MSPAPWKSMTNERWPLAVQRLADARRDDARQRSVERLVGEPQSVRKLGALTGRDRRGRLPVSDDVVVHLARRRNLDELDVSRSPLRARLDPERRPPIVLRLGVLEVGELPLALQQAEALRAVVEKGRCPQRARIRERAPQTLAAAVDDLQTVGIVHGVAIIVEACAVRLIEQEHRRQRRDAERRELDAREQCRLHVDGRLVAGPRRERVSADDRRALQQRVDHDLLGLLRRALDPEVREVRELLALGPRRANGKTARRQSVQLALGDGAKVARALEHEELVEVVGRVDRRAYAKPRIAPELAGGGDGWYLGARRRIIVRSLNSTRRAVAPTTRLMFTGTSKMKPGYKRSTAKVRFSRSQIAAAGSKRIERY